MSTIRSLIGSPRDRTVVPGEDNSTTKVGSVVLLLLQLYVLLRNSRRHPYPTPLVNRHLRIRTRRTRAFLLVARVARRNDRDRAPSSSLPIDRSTLIVSR